MHNLSYQRQQRGLSQYALAAKSGVPRGTIAVYEAYAGRHVPGVETVRKLAAALDVSVNDLIEEGNVTPGNQAITTL